MKQKIFIWYVIICLLVLMGVYIVLKIPQQEESCFRVGIAVYDLEDTYMRDYIDQIQKMFEENHNFGGKVYYEILDAEGNLKRQKKQFQYMCTQEFDVFLINLVKPASAASILNKAADLQIPVILFNRETEEKNLEIAETIWYVGTDAKAAGEIQGDMLTKLWREHETEMDHNQNGKLDYILVEGEEAHFDAVRRTKGFLEHSSEIQLNQLEIISAEWKRSLAYEEFSKLDKQVIQNAEAVVCHNDDMALGIYDYCQEHSLQMPVILGINHSLEMNEKIKSKEIYGTVDNNIPEQIDQISKLLDDIFLGKESETKKKWYSTPYAVYE